VAKTIIIYLAREWLTWFLGCVLFLVGTIFLFSLVEDIEQVFPRGSEDWYQDLWYWLISYLPWLLPICCLGASLFSLSFARKRGEWTAMLANGISPWQTFVVLGFIGFLIGWGSDWLMNASASRNMGLSDIKVRSLKMQVGKDRLWYFRSFDPASLSGAGLQLFCYGEQGEDVMRIRSNKASWSKEKGWSFEQGRFLGFYSSLGLPVIDQDGQSIDWEKPSNKEAGHYSHDTKSPGMSRSFEKLSGLPFSDDPTPYLWLQKRAKDMSVHEIDRLLSRFPNPDSHEMVPYQLRKAQLWWNGPACFVALLIGLGMASAGSSSTPGKLAGVSLVGALLFYLIRTLSDSLGEQQILSPLSSASLPYILILLVMLIFIKIQK
jgi:lipopolysaccharide export LptBFGC system permease protein LptF